MDWVVGSMFGEVAKEDMNGILKSGDGEVQVEDIMGKFDWQNEVDSDAE